MGIVQSTFNAGITDGLVTGALEVLEKAGAVDVTLLKTPGAFELPLAAQRLAADGHDAVVALGAVILGETDHYEHIAHRASEGLQQVMLETGVPIGFGLLTVRRHSQAVDRSEPGPGNKGGEAAAAAVQMAQMLRMLPAADS